MIKILTCKNIKFFMIKILTCKNIKFFTCVETIATLAESTVSTSTIDSDIVKVEHIMDVKFFQLKHK